MKKPKLLSLSLAATLLMLSVPAFALPAANPAGEEKATEAPKKSSPKKIKCKRGETAKFMLYKGKKQWRCIKLNAGALTDNELYQTARALADDNEYDWALDHLRLISRQQDPAILTYTGYSHRKAGRLETGIAFYQQALAVKPDYAEAREYLGEAFVLSGFADRAQEQLTRIEQICGTSCEAYVTLKRFIAGNSPLNTDGANP